MDYKEYRCMTDCVELKNLYFGNKQYAIRIFF